MIILGTGDSAIGGALTQALVAPECRVPVIIWRDYTLPIFAGLNTLVICYSHLGNTEETLSACEAALARGARLLIITTGSKLAAFAERHGIPGWRFEHKGQPGNAVGLSFMLTLAALMKFGLASDKSADISEAVAAMRRQQESLHTLVPTTHNPAKRLAGQLLERLGMIFASDYLVPVARRWKEQIIAVAKSNLIFEELPELIPNSIANLLYPEALLDKHLVIFLRSRHDQPHNHLRSEMAHEIYLQAGFNTDAIEAAGQSPLANMLTALHYGEYVAYYLAMAYGVNPSAFSKLEYTPQALHELSALNLAPATGSN